MQRISTKVSSEALQAPTAAGARHIFMRFILVAVGVNALVGAAVVAYNVYDSVNDTYFRLEEFGETHLRQAQRLRKISAGDNDEQVMHRASQLLAAPMALLKIKSSVVTATTNSAIGKVLHQIYRDGRPGRGTRVEINEELGELSGAWVVGPFTSRHDLLVVVTRTPEQEGWAMYMTIAAGITGVGIAVSFFIMLAAANWMLRRPLNRLVNTLTGALARDVQRRKKAEEHAVAARKEAEKHLAFMNSLIDASEAVGIVATDRQDRVQIFNWGAVQILGHSASTVVGKMTLEQLKGHVVRDDRSPLLHAGEGEEFWIDKAGEQLLLYVNSSVIHDAEGDERGGLVTFIDVTDRRKLEAELQLQELQLIQSAKLATLGEMATGIAHEVNQPLNNIGLLSSRVRRRIDLQPLDDEERAFYSDKLAKIQTQVERAGKIIDHLRTFGRRSDTELSGVTVRKPVDGVMVFLREQLTRHGIEIDIDLASDLPKVYADESRLEQVLMNLMVNARDALDQSEEREGESKRISITAHEAELPSGEPALGVEICDNGPGMEPDVVDRIFEPFFTTKEVGKGTGLGLSISYGLVRDFGGVLEVESEPGKGTTFTILLKKVAQEAAAG